MTPNKVVPQVAFVSACPWTLDPRDRCFFNCHFCRRDQHEPFDHAFWIYGNMAKRNIVSYKTHIELKKGKPANKPAW